MGRHVGAIPSVVGGHNVALSHVGTVFLPSPETMVRWKGWYRHVVRDQLIIWLPACVIGLALPSMLSLQFLPPGTATDDWTTAGMTAGGVRDSVGGGLGRFYWYMILFCGFLVLVPSQCSGGDGFVRRWVDVSWTTLGSLRRLDPGNVRYVYFGFLLVYLVIGITLLSVGKPNTLLVVSANLNNFALGFSCFHVMHVNKTLLPKELRPGWFATISMALAGIYFLMLAVVVALIALKWL
mgnify:CR=1 FL=1